MGLIDEDSIRARSTDPATSKMAARKAIKNVSDIGYRIINETHARGPIGLTMSEMSVILQMDKPRFSSLYSKLEVAGYLVRRPVEDKRRGRGRPENVYVAPEFVGIPIKQGDNPGIELPPYTKPNKAEALPKLLAFIESRTTWGATIEECSLELNVDRSTISPWFAPLSREKTVVAPPGYTRKSTSGNAQQVYVAPRFAAMCRR